ncbi:transcriptional activator [Schizosaccharomyces cryophilus OY26]|uniref:Transcriptional activator n=1 Tax=Schizosaccharomyces cryophilus (strain OY26 / ATCC MYA-4695 / CBS 11777 / NBRC 106824 / NRRL Y48691) TaxID=653667 RepID=S9X796_SCHCR|nr:transcriptional activator [Schizosaccharomyces cryophilus OY26]EPY52962.1 transcriptional activator [Schizosaccharomyces cryophilus OY26]
MALDEFFLSEQPMYNHESVLPWLSPISEGISSPPFQDFDLPPSSSCSFSLSSITSGSDDTSVLNMDSTTDANPYALPKLLSNVKQETPLQTQDVPSKGSDVLTASLVIGKLGYAKLIHQHRKLSQSTRRKQDRGLMAMVLSRSEKQEERENHSSDARDAIKSALRKRLRRREGRVQKALKPAPILICSRCSATFDHQFALSLHENDCFTQTNFKLSDFFCT